MGNVWQGPVRPSAMHPPSMLNREPKSTPKKRKPKKGR